MFRGGGSAIHERARGVQKIIKIAEMDFPMVPARAQMPPLPPLNPAENRLQNYVTFCVTFVLRFV